MKVEIVIALFWVVSKYQKQQSNPEIWYFSSLTDLWLQVLLFATNNNLPWLTWVKMTKKKKKAFMTRLLEWLKTLKKWTNLLLDGAWHLSRSLLGIFCRASPKATRSWTPSLYLSAEKSISQEKKSDCSVLEFCSFVHYPKRKEKVRSLQLTIESAMSRRIHSVWEFPKQRQKSYIE